MTITTRALPMILALVSVAAVGACGRQPAVPPPTPAAAPAPAPDTAAQRRARDEAAQREGTRLAAEAAASARAAEEALRRDSEMLRATLTSTIGFEFNKADLRDDAKAALDAKIPILLANTGVTLRIAGHADERGSTEYNLALGSQRAATAKRYLVERGVAEGRIETTSFGEERPVCTESDEGCWARNRRDEFEITAGGPMLTRPRS